MESNSQRKVKNIFLLRLLHGQFQLCMIGVVARLHFERGMPWAFRPIVEKSLQISAGDFFHCAAKVAGFDRLQPILFPDNE